MCSVWALTLSPSLCLQGSICVTVHSELAESSAEVSENPASAEALHAGVDKCHRTCNGMQRQARKC